MTEEGASTTVLAVPMTGEQQAKPVPVTVKATQDAARHATHAHIAPCMPSAETCKHCWDTQGNLVARHPLCTPASLQMNGWIRRDQPLGVRFAGSPALAFGYRR
jgi:hypothetical protein